MRTANLPQPPYSDGTLADGRPGSSMFARILKGLGIEVAGGALGFGAGLGVEALTRGKTNPAVIQKEIASMIRKQNMFGRRIINGVPEPALTEAIARPTAEAAVAADRRMTHGLMGTTAGGLSSIPVAAYATKDSAYAIGEGTAMYDDAQHYRGKEGAWSAGFMAKCAELGLDADELIKRANKLHRLLTLLDDGVARYSTAAYDTIPGTGRGVGRGVNGSYMVNGMVGPDQEEVIARALRAQARSSGDYSATPVQRKLTDVFLDESARPNLTDKDIVQQIALNRIGMHLPDQYLNEGKELPPDAVSKFLESKRNGMAVMARTKQSDWLSGSLMLKSAALPYRKFVKDITKLMHGSNLGHHVSDDMLKHIHDAMDAAGAGKGGVGYARSHLTIDGLTKYIDDFYKAKGVPPPKAAPSGRKGRGSTSPDPDSDWATWKKKRDAWKTSKAPPGHKPRWTEESKTKYDKGWQDFQDAMRNAGKRRAERDAAEAAQAAKEQAEQAARAAQAAEARRAAEQAEQASRAARAAEARRAAEQARRAARDAAEAQAAAARRAAESAARKTFLRSPRGPRLAPEAKGMLPRYRELLTGSRSAGIDRLRAETTERASRAAEAGFDPGRHMALARRLRAARFAESDATYKTRLGTAAAGTVGLGAGTIPFILPKSAPAPASEPQVFAQQPEEMAEPGVLEMLKQKAVALNEKMPWNRKAASYSPYRAYIARPEVQARMIKATARRQSV